MPDKNGVDTLRVIKQIRPAQGVLMLSDFPESQYAINLLKAGANGYLYKDAEPDEIVRAIRTVARRHRYLSEFIADALADKLEKPAAERPARNAVRARVPDLLQARARAHSHRDRAGTASVGEDGEHISRARAGEDAAVEQ